MKIRLPRATTLTFVGVLGVFLARYAMFDGALAVGDGHYSWVFARSLAFDHDLQLANDYALCGDPWNVGHDEGGGRPANPFYLGPALIWAPLLRLAAALHPLPSSAAAVWRSGCAGPWQRFALFSAPVAGALVVLLGGLIARRFASERQCALAMLAVAFGTTLTHFATLVPSYSHVWAALGVALALWTWVRARERPSTALPWLVAGFAVGGAALIRAQAALLVLLPASTLALRSVDHLRARRVPRTEIVQAAALGAGFVAVFGWQLVAYKILYGHWWVIAQGKTYVQLAHAHPWLLLFAARGGLLHWTPLAWMGLWGFVPLVRDRRTRPMALALIAVLLLDLNINAAPLDWHGGATYGARRLTVLAAPFTLTLAWAIGSLWRLMTQTPARALSFAMVGWMLPWCVLNLGASTGNTDGRVPFDRGVSAPELYGNGLRYALEPVQQALGNPLTLPASLVYALRYGAPPSSFDRVATGGFFNHSYRPVTLAGADTVSFADPSLDVVLAEGLTRTPTGAVLRRGARGRMLVPLAWPFVTDAALTALPMRAGNGFSVRVRTGSFFRRRDGAVFAFGAGGGVVERPMPRGALDSGINELIFEASEDCELRGWRFIDRSAHDTSLW